MDKPTRLFISIPEIPNDAGFHFHPISISQNPKFYRPEDLGDTGYAPTSWMKFFEEIFMGIYWKISKPVPFAFTTADGRVRSLDAGCIKWMLNREPRELSLTLGERRLIVGVSPTQVLIDRYKSQKLELVNLVSLAQKA